jgi:hypothetical protein
MGYASSLSQSQSWLLKKAGDGAECESRLMQVALNLLGSWAATLDQAETVHASE